MQVPGSPLAVVQGVLGRASRGPWTTMCPSRVVALHVNRHWPSSAGCENGKCLFILRFLLYLSCSARPTDSSGLLGNREINYWNALHLRHLTAESCLPTYLPACRLSRLSTCETHTDYCVHWLTGERGEGEVFIAEGGAELPPQINFLFTGLE